MALYHYKRSLVMSNSLLLAFYVTVRNSSLKSGVLRLSNQKRIPAVDTMSSQVLKSCEICVLTLCLAKRSHLSYILYLFIHRDLLVHPSWLLYSISLLLLCQLSRTDSCLIMIVKLQSI